MSMMVRFAQRLCGALVLFVVMPGLAIAQQWQWKAETIDNQGAFTAIAIDISGSLHVSYVGQSGVQYAFRPANGTKWFRQAIDKGNSYTSIALDAGGNPHICYTSYGMLKYASFGKRGWNPPQQVGSGSGNIMFSCSVAVAPTGVAHLLWYQVTYGGADYYHVKHAELRNGLWEARTVDFDLETGKWNSMRLDANGTPHIAYSAYRQGEQKYASWNGREWSVSTVDSRRRSTSKTEGQQPGYGNSIAISKDGTPFISYMDEGRLKLARRDGETWSVEVVDQVSSGRQWSDYRTSLVLDSAGRPHIAYEDVGTVKHAYFDGNKWRIQTIIPSGPEGSRFASMAIDSRDTLHISYRDPVDGSLRLATGSPVADTEQPKAAPRIAAE